MLENLTDDAIALLFVKKFSIISRSLFDLTLRHIELGNSVICHIQRNPPKHFLLVQHNMYFY